MIERKKYGITLLSASGKEKYISGAADFGAAARRGHGFHTRPQKLPPVILFGHFYRLKCESFPIINGLYFPNFMYFRTYFPNFSDIFPKCEGKCSFPNSQIFLYLVSSAVTGSTVLKGILSLCKSLHKGNFL